VRQVGYLPELYEDARSEKYSLFVFDAVIPWTSPSSDADSFSVCQVTSAFYGTRFFYTILEIDFTFTNLFLYLNKILNTLQST
jgi:hypothetical protein